MCKLKLLIINFALRDRLASSIVAVNLMCIDVFKSELIMHISNIGVISLFKLFHYIKVSTFEGVFGGACSAKF